MLLELLLLLGETSSEPSAEVLLGETRLLLLESTTEPLVLHLHMHGGTSHVLKSSILVDLSLSVVLVIILAVEAIETLQVISRLLLLAGWILGGSKTAEFAT